MSIATELQTLAANKAAIKAAIEGKSPSVAPTDDMSNWPASIASICQKPYDAEVEYLESTGTQYIDTGVSATLNTRLTLTFLPTPDDFNWVFGARSTTSDRFCLFFSTSSFSIQVGSVVSEPPASVSASLHSLVLDKDALTFDGTSFAVGATNSFVGAYPVFIFCLNNSGAAFGRCPARVYACAIYDSGTIVRDLVPVRVGAVGCLYDRRGVGGMNPDGSARDDGLYYNRGSGSFVMGADKPTESQLGAIRTAIEAKDPLVQPTDDYDTWPTAIASIPRAQPLPYDAEVEYLKSDGTQWVDTGFVFGPDATFEVDCAVYDATLGAVSAFIFGGAGLTNGYYVPKTQGGVANTDRHVFFSITDAQNTSINPSTVWANNTRHTMKVQASNRTCYLDGVSLGQHASTLGYTTVPLALMARSLNGTAAGFAKMYLYSVTATTSSTIIRDLHPVRVGTLGYLYDRANPTGGPLGNGLYGNAADNNNGFPANLVGPDINT